VPVDVDGSRVRRRIASAKLLQEDLPHVVRDDASRPAELDELLLGDVAEVVQARDGRDPDALVCIGRQDGVELGQLLVNTCRLRRGGPGSRPSRWWP
jgi:hypothetical protein